MTDEAHEHEIVIIKRHGGHEDAHHGGVWKIAFADFMTAMMAFFLVMWLISANDKTKAVIAKYFNPVQLVDSTPQPRGLNDSKKDDPSVERKTDKTPPDAKPSKDAKPDAEVEAGKPSPVNAETPTPLAPVTKDAKAPTAHDEAELSRDPYAVLADLATKANPETPPMAKKPATEEARRGAGSQGNKGGEAFRDPFQPPPGDAVDEPTAEPGARIVKPGEPLPGGPGVPATASASVPASPASGTASPAEADEAADKPMPAAALRDRIAALGKAMEGSAAPKLEVRKTGEGLLISLTDSADFSMFPSASARPAAKMVALVEKIGTLLKTQRGAITVRGFTDNHPFKSDTYDNWRLSTARAHMAHYMLVQGGVPDDRIDHVEGYADRRPRNPKDPGAAENRRIEILLRDTTP